MDDYHLTDQDRRAPESPSSGPGSVKDGLIAVFLWVVLVASAVANGASSLLGLHPLIGATFGVVTVAAIVALVMRHLRAQGRR